MDVMAGALKRLPSVRIPPRDRPRLAEFASLGVAVAETQGIPGSTFLQQLNEARQESIARTIDASPVASALIEWFEGDGRREVVMAVKDLFTEVERRRPPGTDAWPKSAKGFADALRRAAPALRQLGIEVRSLGKVGGTIEADPAQQSAPSRSRPHVEWVSREEAARWLLVNEHELPEDVVFPFCLPFSSAPQKSGSSLTRFWRTWQTVQICTI